MSVLTFPETGLLAQDDTQKFPLGFEITFPADFALVDEDTTTYPIVDRGARTFVYVYNDSGATLAARYMMRRKAGEARARALIGDATTEREGFLGIPMCDIADLKYGFVQKKGPAYWIGDAGNDQVNSGVMCNAAGECDAAAGVMVAGRVLGWAFASDGGAAVAVPVHIDI